MQLLICVLFGEYVILIKNYSQSDKSISLLLYSEGSIIFSFLVVSKNQLKKQKF